MKWISKLFVSLVGITLMAAIALPVHAGWIELDNNGGRSVFSKGLFKNSNQNEDTWSIMNMNSKTMTMVSDKRKIYSTGTMQEYCASMSGMMKKMKANMDAAMAGMSPEQRQMMEQMMGKGKRPDPKVSIANEGNGGVIAGFKTTKYLVSVDGKPHKEVWLTTDSALMKATKPYMSKFSEMSDEMSKCGSGGGMNVFIVENTKEYNKLMRTGYTLREKDAEMSHFHEVTSLKQESIPASEFAVPKGYKKMSFEEMMQLEFGGEDR